MRESRRFPAQRGPVDAGLSFCVSWFWFSAGAWSDRQSSCGPGPEFPLPWPSAAEMVRPGFPTPHNVQSGLMAANPTISQRRAESSFMGPSVPLGLLMSEPIAFSAIRRPFCSGLVSGGISLGPRLLSPLLNALNDASHCRRRPSIKKYHDLIFFGPSSRAHPPWAYRRRSPRNFAQRKMPANPSPHGRWRWGRPV